MLKTLVYRQRDTRNKVHSEERHPKAAAGENKSTKQGALEAKAAKRANNVATKGRCPRHVA